ncbi:MAG: hypothetical protein PVH92_13130, partial [Anaerolineales bacterium]
MRKMSIEGVILLFCVSLFSGLYGCTDNSQRSVMLADETPSVYSSEIVAVIGTQMCSRKTFPGGTAEDGARVLNEQFTCNILMSDPRVSGAEVLEVESLEYERHSMLWTAEGIISNDNGTWRGTGKGVLRKEGGSPYNYGEMIYTGEGEYTGLIFRYLVAGSNEQLKIAGWIEPSGFLE